MKKTFLMKRIAEMLKEATEQELQIIYQYIRTLLYG